MDDSLQFKVSSALKDLVGRDLITSDNVAIFELVKNSYDAYADHVTITFAEDKITIEDNGKGMSYSDLRDKWLFLGFSAKKDGTEERISEKQKSYRDKIKRNYAGAKGIGRFSCDRLGRYLTITTKVEGSSKIEQICVDWAKFEENQKIEFESIDVIHRTLDSSLYFSKEREHGTVIEITDLHDEDTPWSRKHILELKSSLQKLINPFSEVNDFVIDIVCDREKMQDIERSHSGEAYDRDIVNGPIKNSITEVLKLKTTQIYVNIIYDTIYTTLQDRGVDIYRIKEHNNMFPLIHNGTVSISFLNRAAKYNFHRMMGVDSVRYGSVFLFRNGFRILPFGETGDDSWGVDFKAQQGRRRYVSSRDLLGRVDISVDDVNDLKEVSSRDGGLVESPMSRQVLGLFTLCKKRLERYVVGVLWGEGFLRYEYYKNSHAGEIARKELQKVDKESEEPSYIFTSSLGSKIDFVRLIKTLSSDDNVEVLYYNTDLANFMSAGFSPDEVKPQFISDLETVAERTGDKKLIDKIEAVKKQVAELTRQKLEAEQRAAEAERLQREAEKKAREEEGKRKQAEKEKHIESLKVEFYKKASNPDTDALIHHVKNNNSRINDEIDELVKFVNSRSFGKDDSLTIIESLSNMKKLCQKTLAATNLILNCDLAEADSQKINLPLFVKGYLSNEVKSSVKCHFDSSIELFVVYGSKLDLALLIDNFVKNSEDWHARNIWVKCTIQGNALRMDIYDDGDGLIESFKENPNQIFEFSKSGKQDGSGFGMYLIKETLKSLHAEIEIDEPVVNKGMHFNILFK